MGGKGTKFIVCNASKETFKVEVCNKKAGKKVNAALVEIKGIKIKPKQQIHDINMTAEVQGGTEYEFSMDEKCIGGNVRFISEHKQKYLQHKVKKGMIISASGDLLYSDNLEHPWVSGSGVGNEINHKKQWDHLNEYQIKMEKLKHQYGKNRLDVSKKRKKKFHEIEEAYSNEKNSLKHNVRNEIKELKESFEIDNDEDEDFLESLTADEIKRRMESASTKKEKKGNVKNIVKDTVKSVIDNS